MSSAAETTTPTRRMYLKVREVTVVEISGLNRLRYRDKVI
jgi:hypothetical protein